MRVMFMLGTYRPEQRRVQLSFHRFFKRSFDIVVSAAGLLLLSPIILLISFVIMIESGWPALHRYKRYNSMNVEFNIFKFRTTIADMKVNTLHDTFETTGVDQILHRSGADKIPQLMNVLRGEMSIVGSHLFTDPPGTATAPLPLGDIKPGLLACMYPHDDHDIADTDKNTRHRINCDRHYIENSSLLFDIRVIFCVILSKNTWLCII